MFPGQQVGAVVVRAQIFTLAVRHGAHKSGAGARHPNGDLAGDDIDHIRTSCGTQLGNGCRALTLNFEIELESVLGIDVGL